MYSDFVEDVTIYSRHVAGGAERWHRTQVCGVSWRHVAAAHPAMGGPVAADGHVVRIPAGGMPAGWVPPRRWQAMAEPGGHWTVQPGDLVVRGLCDIEVSLGIAQVTDAVAECFFAGEVRENLRGAPAGRHLLVRGA